jgi:hypothetical protein
MQVLNNYNCLGHRFWSRKDGNFADRRCSMSSTDLFSGFRKLKMPLERSEIPTFREHNWSSMGEN